MLGAVTEQPTFPPRLDLVAQHAAGQVYFGPDVLKNLVAELARAAALPRSSRSWGPGVLGCAMWMDDPDLMAALAQMANSCIVVTKQPHYKHRGDKTAALHRLANESGLAQDAFPELAELAPHVDGQPLALGPHGSSGTEHVISGVREVGFRKVGERLVPIVHAKILLLGDMFWTDEHPSGYPGDYIGFVPRNLWIGSANFTRSSRLSMEMGMWTTDPALLEAARTWLLRLIALSEPLAVGADDMAPELLPVEYDDAAIIEYLREIEGGWPDDD